MNTPHLCPVCQGRGLVPPGFYDQFSGSGYVTSSSTWRPTCRACQGNGIIWERDLGKVERMREDDGDILKIINDLGGALG